MAVTEHIGKTIKDIKFFNDEKELVIDFTDGSFLTITAKSSEEKYYPAWLEISTWSKPTE